MNEVKEHDVKHRMNLVHIATKYGYKPEDSISIRQMAEEMLEGKIEYDDELKNALTQAEKVQKLFITKLERTLNPLNFGIKRKWRKTQHELLLATLSALSNNYVRLLSEVPTGSGKSMCIGAKVRAALDTMKELGLDWEIHIFTSRIAIAGQLIEEEIPSENSDRPLEMGKKGDVRIWCPDLEDNQIRLLAGRLGQNQNERNKNAKLTVSTYQGLNANKIYDIFKKKPFIIICDESHRVTERVAIFLEQMNAITFGLSATVLGPERDPFMYFEKIEKDGDEKSNKSYIDNLCYFKSIAEMIRDQELKPVRWLKVDGIRISVSEAELRGKGGVYDVFNNASVSRILMRNSELLVDVISEAYLGDHPGLILSGSKSIVQRRGIVFVDRVETAQLSAKKLNEILLPKLKEKYGNDVKFLVGYVSGVMPKSEYDQIIKKFRSGEITLLMSVDMIGEGVDLPFVDLIILLRVLGLGSQWKLVQALGRGVRIDENDLTADLAVLDMVFTSERHLLASVLGIFGRGSLLSGGLIAGVGGTYEMEMNLFKLIHESKNWKEVYQKMTDEEREAFPGIKKFMEAEKLRGSIGIIPKHTQGNDNIFELKSISFIEQDDYRLAISLGNHDELVKFTIKTLIEEGINTIEKLVSTRNTTLQSFALNRIGQFRDGLTMVNLNLKTNAKELNVSNMQKFINLMSEAGLPNERIISKPVGKITSSPENKADENKIVKDSESSINKISAPKPNLLQKQLKEQKEVKGYESSVDILNTFTRNLFGKDAEINIITRPQFKNDTQFAAQGFIALPEGLKYSTHIRTELDIQKAKQDVAAELQKVIQDELSKNNITLYKGSVKYSNYLKALRIIILEYTMDDIYFKTISRGGIFTIEANVDKYKHRHSGSVAIHTVESVGKMHAEIMLAIELIKFYPTFENLVTKVNRNKFDELESICKDSRLGTVKRINNVKVIDKLELHIVTLKVQLHEETAYGVSPENARERAATGLLEKIKQSNSSLN